MEKYLQPLKTKLMKLLPDNSNFTLEDRSQSFVVFPTNHIELVDYLVNIEVATCVYGVIKEHDNIITNIKELYTLLCGFSDSIEAFVSINPLDDNTIRLNYGGINTDQDYIDFNSVNDLINHLKINQ